MIRKYNYTGRQKISKERIKISQTDLEGIKSFSTVLNIGDLGFPDFAKVYIEPYFKSSFMRFEYGSVARITPPANTILSDIPITDKILYRLKIVDESRTNGLILGYADELIANSENQSGGKKPLLPVDFNDLGKRVWKLEFREEGPVLAVNYDGNIEKIREIVAKDKMFISLVYPEVIRQIAIEIISSDDFDFEDDSNEWQALWIKFFKHSLGVWNVPSNKETKEISEWSDEVSEAFCRKNNVINLLNS